MMHRVVRFAARPTAKGALVAAQTAAATACSTAAGPLEATSLHFLTAALDRGNNSPCGCSLSAAASVSLPQPHALPQQWGSILWATCVDEPQQLPLSVRSRAAAFASVRSRRAVESAASHVTPAAAAVAREAGATAAGDGEIEAAATTAALRCSLGAAAAAPPSGLSLAPLPREAGTEKTAAAASVPPPPRAAAGASSSPTAAAACSPSPPPRPAAGAESPSAAAVGSSLTAAASSSFSAAGGGDSLPAAAAASSPGVKSGVGTLEAIPVRDPLVNASFSSKKIPKNYVKETLIPHLESQIVVMAKGLDEQQLTSLAAAYAKLPPELRHKELEKELCSKILFRVDGYNPQQIVQVLWPVYTLLERHELKQQLSLWRAFAERIEKEFILRELSVLNLICISRVYQKIQDRLLAENASPRRHSVRKTASRRSSSIRADDNGSSNSEEQHGSSGSKGGYGNGGSAMTLDAAGDAVARAAASGGRAAVGRTQPRAAAAEEEEAAEEALVGGKGAEDREAEKQKHEEEEEFGGFLRMLEELLRKGLTTFDAVELHDVVVSLSQHHRQTRRDVQLLQMLLPLLEARVGQLSLLHLLSLLRALVKMKILHTALFDQAAAELQNTQKVKRMPPKYVAQVVWLFARVGRLFDVACTMVPLMEQHISSFSPVDFARLAQALPPQSTIPLRICQNLQPRIASFTVNDFCFFFAACVRLCLLPDAGGAIPRLQRINEAAEEEGAGAAAALVMAVDGKELLQSLLSYMHQHEDGFKREDIRRVVLVIEGYKEDYGYLLEQIPAEWKDIGPSLDILKDKADMQPSASAPPP